MVSLVGDNCLKKTVLSISKKIYLCALKTKQKTKDYIYNII